MEEYSIEIDTGLRHGIITIEVDADNEFDAAKKHKKYVFKDIKMNTKNL